MLKQEIIDKLNEQINLEFYSSNLYLQMAAWCEFKGLSGSARFLTQHAQEEMGHMQRLFTYVNETGVMAKLGQIAAPPTEFESLVDVFEKTYKHECFITGKINGLADTAFHSKDYSTFNFLQWYVGEQHEEEALFKGILDKIEVIGTDGKGLFFIDQEIGKLAAGAAPAGTEMTGTGAV
jgi:ferritin